MIRQIETEVRNPDFKLFVDTLSGKYGYSLNCGGIVWCESKEDAEKRGNFHNTLSK